MIRTLTRLLACRRGTAAIEFAIVGVIMITLSVGVIDFGRTIYVKNQLSRLADQASRQIMMDPTVSAASITTDITEGFDAGDPGELAITVTDQVGVSTNFRIITIDYPMTLFVPGLDSNTLDLSVSRRVPVS